MIPRGEQLREQIGYHLDRSKELADGEARDHNGLPITDAAHIAMSTTWHHARAQVLATVMLADATAPPSFDMAVMVGELGGVEVGGAAWLPDFDPDNPGPHTAPARITTQ